MDVDFHGSKLRKDAPTPPSAHAKTFIEENEMCQCEDPSQKSKKKRENFEFVKSNLRRKFGNKF
jgi:hypothetical protein